MTETKLDHFTIVQVLDEDDRPQPHTQCPACGTLDEVFEKDIAVRWNSLSLADDGNAAFASLGDSHFDGDGYICGSCLAEFGAPDGFEILDWS